MIIAARVELEKDKEELKRKLQTGLLKRKRARLSFMDMKEGLRQVR